MRIEIELFAQLASRAGFEHRTLELEGPSATAAEALAVLAAGDDSLRDVREHVMVFVNDRHEPRPADCTLGDGDRMFLTLPIAGG